jgi:hypothetical protein
VRVMVCRALLSRVVRVELALQCKFQSSGEVVKRRMGDSSEYVELDAEKLSIDCLTTLTSRRSAGAVVPAAALTCRCTRSCTTSIS